MARVGDDLSAIDAEIASLETGLRSLKTGLGEFAHEIRRAEDTLERAGARSLAHELRLKRLRENRALTERDIRTATTALDAARLARLEIVSKHDGWP